MKRRFGKLCVITDTVIHHKYSHFEIARLAILGGADVIQFRDKRMPTGDMIGVAITLKKLCAKHNVIFIVNDRVDVALVSGADGVHLGIEDIPVPEARKLLGKTKIIGGTAHSMSEARSAQEQGADYIGYGHIFPTGTKLRITKPKGTNLLSGICRKIKIPVIAIGGIGPENAEEVMNSGAYGIAVIGSVLKSSKPQKVVEKLKEIIYE